MSESPQVPDEFEPTVRGVVAAGGLGDATSIQRLAAGGNNRGYRVATAGATLFVKVYFRDADDPRDRLGAEYGFSRFAWDHGVRALPQPLACDVAAGAAVYEFVEGEIPQAGSIGQDQIREALDFWAQVNQHRARLEAANLPRASEACFSIADHLRCVTRRLDRLAAIGSGDDLDKAAGDLVARMRLAWKGIAEAVAAAAAGMPLAPDQPIDRRWACLSPSDFGFHNALRTPQGRWVFYDFEYAGWDEPAKLVGDFFCQPRVPVPAAFRPLFVDRVMAALDLPDWYRGRIESLLDVYRMKWCCIMLNEFLPAGARRRQFAQSSLDFSARKRYQFRLAEQLLDRSEP